jgi:integrase
MKLNTEAIESIKPPASSYVMIWDSEVKGFGLRVTAKGTKSYIVQTRVRGKNRRITLGKHPALKPQHARKLAKEKIGDLTQGKDQTAEKKARTKFATLGLVTEHYIENRRTSTGLELKESSKQSIRKHIFGSATGGPASFHDWKDQPVTSITREMVTTRYAKLAKRSTAQANQAMRVLRALINYAKHQYRDANDQAIINENPVQVLHGASLWRSVKPRTNFVPVDRLGDWWAAVQKLRHDPSLTSAGAASADMIALLALTGLRFSELASLRWDQVDIEGRSLTLLDTKNRTDLTLPLSELAAEILSQRERTEGYVFATHSNLGHIKDIRTQLKALSEITGIQVTAHDLRRTFRAVAAACNIELWRIKALMNHKQTQDITLTAYADLSDVRNLKPEADRIAAYFQSEAQS